MGDTLFRVAPCIQPFSHTSLDPLGSLQVILRGNQTKKIYSLVFLCLNSGASHIELIEGLEARYIYLAVTWLEMQYNTKVIQLFSDIGTQLSPTILGVKKSVFQQKLGRLWAGQSPTIFLTLSLGMSWRGKCQC